MDAELLATGMPLSHFPARAVLDGGPGADSWPEWEALEPKAQRHRGEVSEDAFDRLREEHVFLYLGPACFALDHTAFGDSVMYFDRALDDELDGEASPFDTGCCRPLKTGGFLQPYASDGPAACQRLIDDQSVPTAGYRAAFQEWLEHCYDDEVRYLETSEDPQRDGTPDRTRPTDILDNNGAAGRVKHRKCADRRAWTWEVRTKEPVLMRRVRAIHVMPASLQTALRRKHELAVRFAVEAPEVLQAPSEPTSPRVLYEDSERVLRHLLGAADDR